MILIGVVLDSKTRCGIRCLIKVSTRFTHLFSDFWLKPKSLRNLNDFLGSNSSDTSSGISDCSKQYDPCEGLSLDDFLPPLETPSIPLKRVKREKKIITSNPNVKIIKIEAEQVICQIFLELARRFEFDR